MGIMKILMLYDFEYTVDTRVDNEIAALADAGHQVFIACSTMTNRPAVEKKGNITFFRNPMSSFIYKSGVGCLRLPFYFNYWRRFIRRVTDEHSFDAVHVHDLPLSQIGLEIKNRLHIPLIIDLHENWPGLIKDAPHTNSLIGRLLSSNKQWRRYEQKMLSMADRVITVIDEAKTRVVLLGIEPEKVFIVSNTLNLDPLILPEKVRDDEKFTVFYGGGINRHRGLQTVIRAIKDLSDRNIYARALIVGDGSYRQELEKLAASLAISSNIEFFGHKPFNEMLGILAISDVAVIPHYRTQNNDATIPHKLFQYMYLEKTVVSSDCVPLKRIVEQTDAGFIYRNDSHEDLADVLEKIITDREMIINKGINGRKAVLEKYNWSHDKKVLTDIYASICMASAN